MAEDEVEASLSQLALVPLPPPNMTTIDITTTDGDILLVLGETRLRVSSVILSSASPVFKAMLGPRFLEGQGDRSAQDPKEITLYDDDVAAMVRLCRLLHHQEDMPTVPQDKASLAAGAEQLLALMILADKYGCVSSIRLSSGYMLFNAAAMPICPDTTMQTYLCLIAAAYMLEDSRHFALFTRRMVLDTPRPYSIVAYCGHLTVLPSALLLLLEEQRKAASTSFRYELPALAQQRCYRHGCGNTGTDLTFANALARKINSFANRDQLYWPPHDNSTSLRNLLKKAFHCGDVDIHLATGCKHEHDYDHKVGGESLRYLCNKISKMACGLCLRCLQDKNTDSAACTHRQLLEQWVNNDPIS